MKKARCKKKKKRCKILPNRGHLLHGEVWGERRLHRSVLAYVSKVFLERTHKILTILAACGERNQMARKLG